MILFGESCAAVIGQFALETKGEIGLPSDICDSVIEKFRFQNVPFSFYPVKRKWISRDEYDLKKFSSKDIILVSDLYNFRSINVRELSGRTVFLDLAHCSLMTANWYIKMLAKYKIKALAVFISFGKGKYYRFGGGGVGFTPSEASRLNIETSFEYSINGLPKSIVDCGLYNEYSTRVIIPGQCFDEAEIKSMRRSGIDISDGEIDDLSERPFSEYIVWKPQSPS